MLLNQEARDLFGISDAFYKMGLVRYYAGNYTEAGQYLNQAMSIADSINSDILRRNIYDVWYSLEESKGNFKKAYEYLNKYVDVVYRIFDEEGQRQVNFLNARYETAKKENEIRKLQDDREIHLLNLKHQRTWILLLSVLLLLTAITVWIFVRNIRYKRRLANQQIKIQEQKIAELEKERQLLAAQAVLQGEEAERKRLACDLHDGLGGMLSVVKLKLLNMKGNVVLHESDVPVFHNALEMLDGSIRELRRVAHNLMPESLMRYGLKAALTDFCESIDQVNLHFFGEERRMEEKYEVASFRIIQELVNNAIKHSEAEQINVQVIIENDRMNLVVQDNGKGFDPALVDKTKTTGLSSIRSRVESLSGQMDLLSSPGQGTEVQIEFKF